MLKCSHRSHRQFIIFCPFGIYDYLDMEQWPVGGDWRRIFFSNANKSSTDSRRNESRSDNIWTRGDAACELPHDENERGAMVRDIN